MYIKCVVFIHKAELKRPIKHSSMQWRQNLVRRHFILYVSTFYINEPVYFWINTNYKMKNAFKKNENSNALVWELNIHIENIQ